MQRQYILATGKSTCRPFVSNYKSPVQATADAILFRVVCQGRWRTLNPYPALIGGRSNQARSGQQKQAYLKAFEADITNLLGGAFRRKPITLPYAMMKSSIPADQY